MATIADVARQAGVSMMTVSRVINNSGAVSDATREKVEAAIRNLGYRPNMVARSLATNRTRMIAYVVSDLANPFFPEVSKGVHSMCRERGYLAIVYDVSDRRSMDDCLELLVDQRVAGVVFHHMNLAQAQVDQLMGEGVKCVTIDNEYDLAGITTIESDNYTGARRAARLLIDRGHRRIGCVHGHYADSDSPVPDDLEYTETFQRRIWRDRTRGFLDELREAGLEPACMIEGRGSAHYAIVNDSFGAAGMSDADDMPTALYCENDLIALGVLGECLKRHVSVPDRLAIVGHDGLDFGVAHYPRLTTIRQPRYETGRLAAERLIKAIELDGAPEHIMTRSDLFRGDTV